MTEVVVLPTPPFWLATARIFIGIYLTADGAEDTEKEGLLPVIRHEAVDHAADVFAVDAFAGDAVDIAAAGVVAELDAVDDLLVPPAHSANFFKALQAAQIPSRYLELPSGGHGLNRYQGPMWEAWQKQSLEWLREMGLL